MMKVTYRNRTDNKITEIEPALLVVACEPRALEKIMDYTNDEHAIFDKLQNFAFFTTCVKVFPARTQDRVVILNPTIARHMAGHVHGYRNETAKQWGLDHANRQETNLVTIYQIVGAGEKPLEGVLFGKLHEFMTNPPFWWPFRFGEGEYEIVRVNEEQPGGTPPHPAVNPLYTAYFDQFRSEDLLAGLPWKWLGLQGANQTIYVHGSTCFESVLHCWSYINKILTKTPNAQAALPADKGAPIVIVGAGVSGLLYANYLSSLQYTNVTLLEKSDRYGGKTHSLQYVPDGVKTTTCELGTCYMDPAYDEMVEALSEFTELNERYQIANGPLRGVVYHNRTVRVVSFSDYGLMRACEYLHVPFNEKGIGKAMEKLAEAVLIYIGIRYEIFRDEEAIMPLTQPAGDPHGIFSKTLAQFLDDNKMGVFKGYFDYVYEVQGYGALEKIPAYYGLVWITPKIAWPWGPTAGETGWKNGWEDVWVQMVKKLDLNVLLNTDVLAIRRT
jgi:hypothetical protein